MLEVEIYENPSSDGNDLWFLIGDIAEGRGWRSKSGYDENKV